MEKTYIRQWINSQSVKYYSTQLNYWVTVDGYDRRANNTLISYSYDLYDFDRPVERRDIKFGYFDELKAVENVLCFIHDGEEALLLVPSSLV